MRPLINQTPRRVDGLTSRPVIGSARTTGYRLPTRDCALIAGTALFPERVAARVGDNVGSPPGVGAVATEPAKSIRRITACVAGQ